MDRTSVSSISPLSSPRPRSSSSERTLETSEENKRTMSPPPPIPCRQTVNNKTNSDDYEAISTLGLLTRNVAMAPMTPTLQKLATKMPPPGSLSSIHRICRRCKEGARSRKKSSRRRRRQRVHAQTTWPIFFTAGHGYDVLVMYEPSTVKSNIF